MDYPETPFENVADSYHGITVRDPYRWLEDGEDPRVKAWTVEQNELTRTFVESYPGHAGIHDRLKELYSDTTVYFGLKYISGTLFALKWQPPRQQPYLVTLGTPFDLGTERIVFDPNEYDPTAQTAIDFYQPSHDAKLVALSLSEGGSEDGTLHLFEVAAGRHLPDRIPRVQYPTGGGSVAWAPGGEGLYLTRYPHPGERPEEDLNFFQQVYFHRLGDSSENDSYVIGEEFPRIAEIELESTPEGALLALVRNGDGGEIAHYLRRPDGSWQQVTRFEDEAKEAALGPDGYLYFLSRLGAPRGQILRLPLANPSLANAEVLVPERPGAIESFLPTDQRLYFVELDGGPSRLFSVGHDGQDEREVPVEPISSVLELVHDEGDSILFRSMSFVSPSDWYRFNAGSGVVERTALYFPPPADFDDYEVVREFAVSRDGTRVPLNIIRPKGAVLDGRYPTLLTGYGGYGINLTPYFTVRRRVWFDRGGIIAVANLRGGGEYGDDWHKAGNLVNKQNVFDDFLGCARHLVNRGYTTSEKLCIEGGSNGGLLMGAAFTQAPELFRAVVTRVGIYDMLRVELDPNGAFNITEFGTVKNPQHFEALFDYSPYHRVEPGTAYPAILFTTGEHDGRVNPAQSRKMAGLMQAATGSDRPILLRVSTAGHGMGTSLDQMLAEEADVYAFLFKELGL